MAITTRYFSTAAAGAGDGTTWADRAVLFSGGAWSTVITGFNFSGTDSLKCLIGPGTHTITVAMAGALFANPPTVANSLFMHGCNSSGTQLTPPDEDWVSAQPDWDDSGLATIATTTDVQTSTLVNCLWRLVHFTATARTGGVGAILQYEQRASWCSFDNSSSGTGARCSNADVALSNCTVSMTGSSYNCGIEYNTYPPYNCRVTGVTGTAGARNGFTAQGHVNQPAARLTAVGNGGNGLESTSTNVVARLYVFNSSFINNGGSGIKLPSTASQTVVNVIENCLCTGNGAYGLDAQSGARVYCLHNRFRDNTSGNVNGLGNYPELDSETTDTDDATEYVDAAGGDYRIKNTAATWGRGLGAGDQAAAGGGGEHAYAFAG